MTSANLKTPVESNFDALIRYPFHALLKPFGYHKKRNSFYLPGEIGKLINIQKSQSNTKDQIKFTVNLSLFSDAYWQLIYNYSSQPVPAFPRETECVFRKHLGYVLGHSDQWYTINQDTVMSELIAQMETNLTHHILPYLDSVTTLNDLLQRLGPVNYLERMILLATNSRMGEARSVLDQALSDQLPKSYKSCVLSRATDLGLIIGKKPTI